MSSTSRRRRRARTTRRSAAVRPPQTPYGSGCSRACSRHSTITGQRAQTRFAASSRESRAAVGSLDGAKNSPASSRRHTASACQGPAWSLSRSWHPLGRNGGDLQGLMRRLQHGLLLTTASRARDDAARPTRCARAYALSSEPLEVRAVRAIVRAAGREPLPRPPANSRPSTLQVLAQACRLRTRSRMSAISLPRLGLASTLPEDRAARPLDHGGVGIVRIQRVAPRSCRGHRRRCRAARRSPGRGSRRCRRPRSR